MNTREKFSLILLFFGAILALIPLPASRSFTAKPGKLLATITDEKTYINVDQVARYVVSGDSTILIFDLRSPEEYNRFNIPGSINIPYNQLINKDPSTFLGSINMKNIFYSNGDFDSNFAVAFADGLGYKNNYAMKGGLNEWFNTVMNSSFKGERISARENALFETRTKARKLSMEINSLPDSLKAKSLKGKHFDRKKLDGGCE
jgi:rhodanese-related sulfurtransferase